MAPHYSPWGQVAPPAVKTVILVQGARGLVTHWIAYGTGVATILVQLFSEEQSYEKFPCCMRPVGSFPLVALSLGVKCSTL